MSAPTEILVLGGGYVGVWGARAMVRRLARPLAAGTVRITVVSPLPFHLFHGWTGETLACIIPNEHRWSSLEELLPRCRVVAGEARSVNLGQQRVTVRRQDGDVDELRYDQLLFAMGTTDRMDPIPGLRQHGWSVKDPEMVERLRSELVRRLEQGRPTRMVVAGGGFTGVEMAAAVAELFQSVGKASLLSGTLVHSGETLLPRLRPRFDRLADYATGQLRDHGVDIRCGASLSEVTPEGAILSDGSRVAADMVVSTLGQTIPLLPGMESLPRSGKGRLRTDPTLRLLGSENVWAGGDIAHVPYRRGEAPCPSDALWAIKHGDHVGRNIARTVRGRRARPFLYRGLGQAASLGVGRGVLELYGLQFTGRLGWVLRLGFFLWFMPSRRNALRVIGDWLRLVFEGRALAPQEAGPELARSARLEPAAGPERTA